MTYNTGKLLFIFVIAVVLSCIAAWVIAYRYRKAMQRLMREPVAGVDGATTAPPVTSTLSPPQPVSFADNRRAGI